MQAFTVTQNNMTSLGLGFHHDNCAQENTQLDALIKMFIVLYVVFTLY